MNVKKTAIAFLITNLAFSGLVSCNKTTKPEIKPATTREYNSKPESKLDKQYNPVMHIAMYFEKKEYNGNLMEYSDDDVKVPQQIKADIISLSDEGITYPVLLKSEIEARHYKRFRNPVIQRIFNFTFWYDQKRSKKGEFNKDSLNKYERANLRKLEALIGVSK